MKVRIVGHRVSGNFGVARGRLVVFENGVADIEPLWFDDVAEAVKLHGYVLEKVESKPRAKKEKSAK